MKSFRYLRQLQWYYHRGLPFQLFYLLDIEDPTFFLLHWIFAAHRRNRLPQHAKPAHEFLGLKILRVPSAIALQTKQFRPSK
jgi:hypothetical protein